MVWGSRISLAVGFVAVGIYVMIGIILGSLAGYFGGKVDLIISRFIELMICFPTLVLIITIIAVARDMWIMKIWSGMFAIMLVIGITGWTGIARLIRGEFLRLRNQDFVTAGKALGVSNFRLIFRHIVPNALAPVLVSATFGVASAILVESSLSFLGLGVSPPTPTWGAMLSEARSMPLEIWWLTLFPGMAIFITVTVYNLVGEGIRDAIDPRLKER
ncbi:MAG: ABC transporter permease [Planctomycetota bacterium]|nr:MAG: ABC transporter permease [Planctomycetota bacterium]